MSLFCFCKLTDSLDTSLTLIWNNLQMEASLFAGSCFCELSDDFASVLLEILVNLVTSCETLSTVRFAGVRAFAKMGCSPSQASKAYKVLIPCIMLYCMQSIDYHYIFNMFKEELKWQVLIETRVCSGSQETVPQIFKTLKHIYRYLLQIHRQNKLQKYCVSITDGKPNLLAPQRYINSNNESIRCFSFFELRKHPMFLCFNCKSTQCW